MLNKAMRYFAENIGVTNVFIIIILLIGFFCGSLLNRDISPYVEPNSVVIRIYYPGASAEEVEQDVIIPLEQSIKELETSPEYTSFANENFGQIKSIFVDEKDLEKVKSEFIRHMQNTTDLPKDVQLSFTEEGAQSIPMYSFALYNKVDSPLSEIEFQQFATTIAEQNDEIQGVAQIESHGLLKEEIYIDVDPELMEKGYVSLYEVVQAVRTRNVKVTGGFIELGDVSKKVITDGRYQQAIDVKDTIIRSSFEKQRIRIQDIADVTKELEDVKIDIKINDGKGVLFGLIMKDYENIKKVTKSIDIAIEQYKKQLPEGVELVIIEKRFKSVDAILQIAQSSALVGIIIVFLVLLLFLDWRTAFWTSLGIPITIAALFIYMYFNNMSINIISLCAVITVLGMLVDHGIVISENIYHYRLEGMPSARAVRQGVREVYAPVLVTVITTIAAFMPLTIVSDTIGGLIRPLPIIISVALLFSFFEAMFFLPAHLAHVPDKALPKKQSKKWMKWLHTKYVVVLEKALHYRYGVVLIFVGILIGTGFLAKSMFKDFIFMEAIGTNSLYVNMEGEGGTSFERMKELVEEVKELVVQTLDPSEYTAIKAETGRFDILTLWSKGAEPNRGQVAIYLSPNYFQGRNPEQILDAIKEKINNDPIATNFTRLFYETTGLIPRGKSAVALQFIQEDSDERSNDYINAMKDVYEYMTSIPGMINLEYTSVIGEDQLIVVFDYEKAAQLGIDVQTVSETVKIAAGGLIASKWKSDYKEIAYVIRLDPEYRNSIETIENLLIPNRFARLIRLKEFAFLQEREGVPDILRSQGSRMVQVLADNDPDIITASQIAQKISDYYQVVAHKYPGTKMVIDGEASDVEQSFEDFKIASIIALALIYMVLLGLFKSTIQPFIVLLAIPFGMIGAIWAFYIHGQVLSFMSVIGIIGLMGVVVNDAVVMVEFINTVVRSTSSKKQVVAAIVEGAQKRFNAVLLTTVTTVSGLLPTIYGLEGVADMIVPIATAMAYGLLFATFLTLILIPAIYLIGIDVKYILSKKLRMKNI